MEIQSVILSDVERKNMSNISANIVDGTVSAGVSATYQSENNVGTDALGKDAFLELLVTQMQYQDPLEPTDNTKMISELAQFSSLEAMQNVTTNLNNSQALSIVGKNVIMEVGKSSNASTTSTVAGYVEYVKMVEGKAQLSIGGELYDYEDLDMVIDDDYLASQLNKDSSDE